MRKILLCLNFFLWGCKGILDQAPVTHLYIIDVQHDVCSIRKITDKTTLASVFVKDMPLRECDGNVSLSMQEFLNLRTYIRNNSK